jgi:cephalosporin hydroxylase
MTTTAQAAPVPVLQHPGELDRLLDLYCERQPRRVLEVGSYHGGTLWHWLQNAQPGTIVVSVDHHVHADNRRLYPDWTPAGVTLHVINGDSHDPFTVASAAAHAPYDWILIDADHTLPGVTRDWELYRPYAAPGGIVALHDITPSSDPSIDVAPLWAQLIARHDTIEISEPGGYGIGIVHIPKEGP